jgi:cytochrome c-type biogenesis protein CcmH
MPDQPVDMRRGDALAEGGSLMGARRKSRGPGRHVPGIALAGLLIASIVAAVVGSSSRSPTLAERALAIEHDIRCPSCEALSVATSSAPTAVTLRQVILARLKEGQSPNEIEAYVVSRYGSGILLRPPSSGIASLVWWIPLGAIVLGLAGLAAFFWQRRAPPLGELHEADREMVRRLLEARRGNRGE